MPCCCIISLRESVALDDARFLLQAESHTNSQSQPRTLLAGWRMVDIAGTVLRLAVMAVLYVVLVARAGFVWLRRHVLLAPRRPVPHGTIVQWTEASMARLKHLGVVLPNGSEELADVTGLAELCAWAVGAGCASVAVYQQRGECGDNAQSMVCMLMTTMTDRHIARSRQRACGGAGRAARHLLPQTVRGDSCAPLT